MRWSEAFIPTLRDDPADAEAISHKLLIRGGFIRQLAAGSYTMLPLGQRVRLKVEKIIREEMDAIGGQEMVLPTLHPADVWRKSGRYELMGENLFKLKDRKEVDHVLGMTEEEARETTVYEGKGCRTCNDTGYKGRTALYEVMPMFDDVKEYILQGYSAMELKKEAVQLGMQTLRFAGINKMKEGMISISEVIRNTRTD